MSVDEALLEETKRTNTLLVAVLAELQSWKAPQAPAGCPHPDELLQDLSSMGERWIRCKGCGADVVRKETK